MLLPIETQKSESDQLRFYLPLARTSVIVVSLLMVLFDQEPYSSPISPYMLFLEVTVYNLIAAIYSQKKNTGQTDPYTFHFVWGYFGGDRGCGYFRRV